MEDSFAARVLHQLDGLVGLGCLEMFGGHGLYRGRALFGIVSAGRLYLRTTDATVHEFVRRGMKPFRPGEGEVLAAYYEVPVDVVENRQQLAEWAEAAACRAAPRRRSARAG